MGSGCCKYSPTQTEQEDLIHILKTKPNQFDISDPRIFKYYKKYPDKFKNLLNDNFISDDISNILIYLSSLTRIDDTKNYMLNSRKNKTIKKNTFNNINKKFMTYNEIEESNAFLYYIFLNDYDVTTDNDYHKYHKYYVDHHDAYNFNNNSGMYTSSNTHQILYPNYGTLNEEK